MGGGYRARPGDPRRHRPFPASRARREGVAGARRTVGRGDAEILPAPSVSSRADSFKAQAQRWNSERLADALDMLLEAKALSRTTAVPAEAVTGRHPAQHRRHGEGAVTC